MIVEPKTRTMPDSILEVLPAEVPGGPEALSAWIRDIQVHGGIDTLFEFETWLRALTAFFDPSNLPLDEADRASIVSRNFAPEIHVARLALHQCEAVAVRLSTFGTAPSIPSESAVESGALSAGKHAYQLGDALSQSTPMASLIAVMESADDLGSTIDALVDRLHQDLKLFLGFGRMFRRNLRNCRHMQLLIAQRFRPEFDRVENVVLSNVLRSMQNERERRYLTLSLLYLHRFLRYLKLVSAALENDRPLRAFLAVFSLLHEQSAIFCQFLRSRFGQQDADAKLQSAADLVIHSTGITMERVFGRELNSVACQRDAFIIYTKMENSHGLLRNCYQNSIVALVRAADEQVDPTALFPTMLEGMQSGQRLIGDLWNLRQDLRNELERAAGLDLSKVLERIAQFRETSLRLLMYQDWGEFERCSEKLITAGSELEARTLLRKFVGFLEFLIQEVSKRSVLK